MLVLLSLLAWEAVRVKQCLLWAGLGCPAIVRAGPIGNRSLLSVTKFRICNLSPILKVAVTNKLALWGVSRCSNCVAFHRKS